MKKLLLGVAAVAAIGLSSCSVATTGAGVGVLYTGVTEGKIATSNEIGNKVAHGNKPVFKQRDCIGER